MKHLALYLLVSLVTLQLRGQSYISDDLNSILQEIEFRFCSKDSKSVDSLYGEVYKKGFYLNSYDLNNAAIAGTISANRNLFYTAAYTLASRGVGSSYFTKSNLFKNWSVDTCWNDLIAVSNSNLKQNFNDQDNWRSFVAILGRSDSLMSLLALQKIDLKSFQTEKSSLVKQTFLYINDFGFLSEEISGANIKDDTLILNYPKSYPLLEFCSMLYHNSGDVELAHNNFFDSVIQLLYQKGHIDISPLSKISIFSQDSAIQLPVVYYNGFELYLDKSVYKNIYFLSIESKKMNNYKRFLNCYLKMSNKQRSPFNYRTVIKYVPRSEYSFNSLKMN